MHRPLSAARSTTRPSVACSGTETTFVPGRWRVAPSSTGAGMDDQSGASVEAFGSAMVPFSVCAITRLFFNRLRMSIATASQSRLSPQRECRRALSAQAERVSLRLARGGRALLMRRRTGRRRCARAGAGAVGIGWRHARAAHAAAAAGPSLHRFQLGFGLADGEAALLRIPVEIAHREGDVVRADAEHAAGADDEAVDRLAVRLHQYGIDAAHLLAVAAIDRRADDLRHVFLMQRIDLRRLVRRGTRPAQGTRAGGR